MARLSFISFCAAAALATLGAPLWAQNQETLFVDGASVDLSDYVWQKRVLVIFAENQNDPLFKQQIAHIQRDEDAFRDRDVIVVTDTDPNAKTALRTKMRPRGFVFVLLGKDGRRYLRKPFPWKARALSRSIDKMPLRQQEVRDQLAQ